MPHHPPHVYLDDTWYMLTGSIYCGQHLLQPASHKELVRDQLRALVLEFKLKLDAWVMLNNHYHILVKSNTGVELQRFIRRWHGRTAHDLNGLDQRRGRQVWHNHWDRCLRSEADY